MLCNITFYLLTYFIYLLPKDQKYCSKICYFSVFGKANGNRYEGSWSDGVKNGAGQFFYMDKGQVYEGMWVDDLAKCGQMKDWSRDSAPDATPFPLPPVRHITAQTLHYLHQQYYVVGALHLYPR